MTRASAATALLLVFATTLATQASPAAPQAAKAPLIFFHRKKLRNVNAFEFSQFLQNLQSC